MYRETLAVQRPVLGKDHPSTLRTAMDLASVLSNQGKYAEAEEMYRETLAVQRRVLGGDHHNTLLTAANLRKIGRFG